MSYRLTPPLVRLRDEINAAYPGRSKISDGWIGDLAHQARKSDHNPDANGVVHAIDVTQWDPGSPLNPNDDVAEAVAEHLRRTKDPRIKYVIWRGRMFSSYASGGVAPWTWRPYTGPNGHFHHVHVSVNPNGADKGWGFTRPSDPAKARAWAPFRPGATDPTIYASGGMRHQVAETQLILKALSIRWADPELDPGPIDGIYGKKSQAAVRAFKRRIIALQKALGTTPWPNDDELVGHLTVNMLRFWNNVTA